LHRAALQIVNAGHRLARAAVRHDAGEALGPVVEAEELLPLLVVDEEFGCLHWTVLGQAA
jgi:hypothetical protein